MPYFDGPLTLTYLLLDIAPILLIALPMTLVIITGEIDLSVASVVGLSSVLLGVAARRTACPIPAAGAGRAARRRSSCGALNGFLVAYVGLPSLAVTIGTLALYRGLAVGLLGTKAVTDFPERWTDLAKAQIGEHRHPGRSWSRSSCWRSSSRCCCTSPPSAAASTPSGSTTRRRTSPASTCARTKLMLFVLTGVVSALAGIYYTLRFGSARGDNATGLELQVVAAVLLGGVSIFGGRGALHGVIAGVLLIGVISQRPAPAERHGQRHQHHHRAAAHRSR